MKVDVMWLLVAGAVLWALSSRDSKAATDYFGLKEPTSGWD